MPVTRKKPLLSITVIETAPKKYTIMATFKDAPTIVIDSSNPRQALMQVALQAAMYLIMKQQGMSTTTHAPVPRSLTRKLKEI